MRRRPLIVIFALVLVVLGVSTLSAAGEITLESLAAAISKVMQRQDDFEKRLVVIEKELSIPTPTPTETPEVTATVAATETAAASDTPTATRTAKPTNTTRPTSTPRPTRTAAPTATPTPSFLIVDFSEVPDEYEKNRIRFESRFVERLVYIEGEIDRLTERGDGYQIEFDGDGLDLVCRLPAAARSDVLGLSIGDTAIVYGHAELDSNLFTDDDLLFKECKVASDPDGVILPPTATPTRTPTLTPRPTESPTRTLTFTPGPTATSTHTPTLTPRPTESPTRKPTSTRGPTSTPRPTSTPGPTSTPRPTSTRRPTSTPRPTVAARPSFTVARDAVNARSGPGTNYPIIGTVSRGQTFTPDGRNQAGDWLRFNSTAGQVWVYAPLMTVSGLDRVPVVSTPRPPTPAPTRSSPPTAVPQPRVSCPSNCTEAHNMGMSNMGTGHACYQPKFDRDRDGVACER